MSVIDQIASCEARAVKVSGPASSGKTEAIVRRAMRLLERGIDPSQICILASSGFAAQALRERLAESAGSTLQNEASAIKVQTPLSACVELLDEADMRELSGRRPRLLAKHEYAFVLEDLKTSGISNRRLKNMLGYVYRQWADMKPTASWRTGEEAAVVEQLERSLELCGGMLVQEAPALACACLKKRDAVYGKHAAYVLCDDFQNLSCAEQTAACLMASTQLLICGNPAQTTIQQSDYPNPEGFENFDALRRNVEFFELDEVHGNPQIASFAAALGKHDAPNLAAGSADDKTAGESPIKLIKWNSPDDELNNVTKYLRMAVDRQEQPCHDRNICVLVGNRRWAKLAEKALGARGFKTCTSAVASSLGGDPRDLARARAQIAYTRLNLLADPHDMVAWRSWCGFGNYLTNSDAWAGLTSYALENDLTLEEALDKAAGQPKEPFLRSNVLVERWVSGRKFIEGNAKRRGFALMHAIGADSLPEFKDVADELAGDETAEEIFAAMQRHILDPVFPQSPDVVRICTPAHLCGQSYEHMLVLGMIDGFFPKRAAFEVVSTEEQREQALEQERHALYDAVSKATGTLTLSYFTKAPLELAEQSKMQVARISAIGGERVAWLRPSVFLQDAGASVPATLGGQALMAEQEAQLAGDEDDAA